MEIKAMGSPNVPLTVENLAKLLGTQGEPEASSAMRRPNQNMTTSSRRPKSSFCTASVRF
jgi:hypothetical protein